MGSGKCYVTGEFIRPGCDEYYRYRKILDLPNKVTPLLLAFENGLRAITMDQNIVTDMKLRPRLTQQPQSPYPTDVLLAAADHFFFSSAELAGLSEIRICRVQRVVTGVLLYYSDGNCESLGWVSVNQLEKKETVGAGALWFLVESLGRFPNVTDVRCEEPTADIDRYFRVRCDSILEWWFSYRQCQLSQGERRTPPASY